jgi:cell wall-associated NlpC family hydrolase
MISAEQWLASVNSLLGTPFRHMGANEHGADCYGLLVLAAKNAGIDDPSMYAVKGYRSTPGEGYLLSHIDKFLKKRPYNRLQSIRDQARPGDILVFRIDNVRSPRHLAVYCGVAENGLDYMIHADARARKATKTMLCPSLWAPKLNSIWYSEKVLY